MKKILIGIGVILVVFIILVYTSVLSTPEKYTTSKILQIEDIANIDFKKHDSVLVAANTLYKATNFKKIMQGEQYREAWATPVKVPVVFLDTLFGGLKIIKEGGGKQTNSLKLKAPSGVVYTLRSVDKDPSALIPEFAKELSLENIIIDGISAQHPYGAIPVAAMASAVEILHTHPQIVFIPQQPTLGKYNEDYGNRLFMLEYESEGEVNWSKYEEANEILDTKDLLKFKKEKNKYIVIDEHLLVRNRLFDLLIGDWDRHAKQWGWVIKENDSITKAIPLAADRDNAFFNAEGIIPSIISDPKIMEELRSFKKEIDFLPGLVMPFDRYFLFKTDVSIFEEEAKFLQSKLTDEIIENSLKRLPKAIYDLDGIQIASKIKMRRKDLLDYAIAFKNSIVEKGILQEPLKGSDKVNLMGEALHCFYCW